ncbi:MAG: glycerophosphoryl diester phosphodiesterase membrane domain-containing protein [Caulobacteraceae bacterium]
MSVAESRTAERLDIGLALQDVLRVLARNLGPIALLGVILSGLPIALVDLGKVLEERSAGYIVLAILGGAASLVTRPILAGALIFLAIRELDGEPATLGECLAAGRRRWGTMLGLMIWSGLLIALGAIFLIVPGVVLALRWAVAGPLVALGGRGIQDSMQRSAKLTEGRRWAMLLLYVILFVMLVVLVGLLGLVQDGLTPVLGKVLATTLIDPLSNIFLDVSFAITGAVIYRRLRGDNAGVGVAALSEVFA